MTFCGRRSSACYKRGMTAPSFDGIVFAGGGCRCFWQAGFFSVVAPQLELAPKRVAAASAGAALGCVSLAGRAHEAIENFKARAKDNPRNIYPERLFSSESVFPHESLFRDVVTKTMDAEAFATLRAGPEIHVALTRPPNSRLPLAPKMVAGLMAYQLERLTRRRIHCDWPKQMGFQVEWVRADHCESVDELTELLLHTSCTPPITPAFYRSGAPVFDGGLADNVPLAALPDCNKVLVLLTRRFEVLPQSDRVLYTQPSAAIQINKWDYTDPEGIQDAFDLGRRDGDTFVRDQTANHSEATIEYTA